MSWQDATTGADYRLTDVKLSTGRLVDGQPVRTEFSGDLAAPGEKLTADFNVVARVEPNIADQFYRFSNLSFNVLAAGDAVQNLRQGIMMASEAIDSGRAVEKLRTFAELSQKLT